MEENQKTKNIPVADMKENGSNLAGRIVLTIFVFLVAGSVAAAFRRYMVRNDYVVQTQVECDPESEACFVWECDMESLEEGEKCTGNPDEDVWYYKLVRKNAQNIPFCDPNKEECEEISCKEGETGCSEEFCTPENVPDGENCNDPGQYLLENPPEEECAEDGKCAVSEEDVEAEDETVSDDEENTGETAPEDQSAPPLETEPM